VGHLTHSNNNNSNNKNTYNKNRSWKIYCASLSPPVFSFWSELLAAKSGNNKNVDVVMHLLQFATNSLPCIPCHSGLRCCDSLTFPAPVSIFIECLPLGAGQCAKEEGGGDSFLGIPLQASILF